MRVLILTVHILLAVGLAQAFDWVKNLSYKILHPKINFVLSEV